MDDFDDIMLHYYDSYDSHFLLLQISDSTADILLHSAVSSPDVLILGGCFFLYMGFGVIADAGGAESDVALILIMIGSTFAAEIRDKFVRMQVAKSPAEIDHSFFRK